jgi:hypothetical protein
MKPAEDGLPTIGNTARSLGVRPNVDIEIDVHGRVYPCTGGMSISADSVQNLPGHRRPPEFFGIGKDPVYCIENARLPSCLVVRQNGPQHHYLVEPGFECLFVEYQAQLHQTRRQWTRVLP